MKVSKIKTVIILALVVLNVFFLTFLTFERSKEHSVNKQAFSEISSIYENSGVRLVLKSLPTEEQVSYYTFSTASEELKIVKYFLGDAERQGNIYSSALGNVSADQQLTMDIALFNYTADSNYEKTVRTILNNLSIEDYEINTEAQNITARRRLNGKNVVNGDIRFSFAANQLENVSGFVYNEFTGQKSEKSVVMKPITAAVDFLNCINDKTVSCSSVTSFEVAYYLRTNIRSEYMLYPCWEIDTDTGVYYLDGDTGKLLYIS